MLWYDVTQKEGIRVTTGPRAMIFTTATTGRKNKSKRITTNQSEKMYSKENNPTKGQVTEVIH